MLTSTTVVQYTNDKFRHTKIVISAAKICQQTVLVQLLLLQQLFFFNQHRNSNMQRKMRSSKLEQVNIIKCNNKATYGIDLTFHTSIVEQNFLIWKEKLKQSNFCIMVNYRYDPSSFSCNNLWTFEEECCYLMAPRTNAQMTQLSTKNLAFIGVNGN